MEFKKLAVITAGGDAPGMNAAIRSVVRTAAHHQIKMVGIERGYRGLLQNNFCELNAKLVGGIAHLGGTILKTSRSKEIRTPEGIEQACENLKEANIDCLIVIGGDGSFHAAMGLQTGLDIPIVGIPATIDNDIPGTDETIGFDTAVNTALAEIDKIRDTATSHERLFVVEVMGRNTGFIALQVGIGAGAEMILVPEIKHSFQMVCDQLELARKIGKNSSIIVMAEGVGNSHDFIRRIDELGLYETRLSILGHVQRGGNPSARSRVLASHFGVAAVELLLDGKKRNYIGIRNDKLVTPKLDNIKSGPKPLDEGLLRIANILSRLTIHPLE